jgi:hypothetical protein
MISAGARPQAQTVPGKLGLLHDYGGQVRQQHLEADPVLALA